MQGKPQKSQVFFSANYERAITYLVVHYVFSNYLPLANVKEVLAKHLIGMDKTIQNKFMRNTSWVVIRGTATSQFMEMTAAERRLTKPWMAHYKHQAQLAQYLHAEELARMLSRSPQHHLDQNFQCLNPVT